MVNRPFCTLLFVGATCGVLATGCLSEAEEVGADEELAAEESELVSTSLRAIASRANTNLCFENVSGQIRLRPCVVDRNQQKVAADVISVAGPTLRLVKLRANSGNCFSAGTTSGNLVVLRACGDATSWFEFDFSGSSVFVSESNSDLAIAVDSAVDNEPVRVRPTNTDSLRQRWFNK